jgi:hypothetical protein
MVRFQMRNKEENELSPIIFKISEITDKSGTEKINSIEIS